MTDDTVRSDRAFLDEVRRNRDALFEQIRQSKITIEKSLELLGRMDEMISQAEQEEIGHLNCLRPRRPI